MEFIGRKVRELRKNKNVTQEQLAEVLSVSNQAVSKWENNSSAPDIELLPVIAGYFGITMDELFGYRLDALSYKERFIRFMVDNGVLRFGNFELNSGRISPYFIDTGNYRSGAQLTKLGEFYAECIRDHGICTDVLFGPAYKGIPLSVAVSMTLYRKYGMDVNYCFDRKEGKKDREGGLLVGKQLEDGENVTIIVDTLTSGFALREVVQKVKSIAEVTVSNVVISVDRMEKGMHRQAPAMEEIENELGVQVFSIVTIKDIIHAMETGIIAGTEHLPAMISYFEQYGGV